MGKSKIITYVIVAVLVIVGLYWVYTMFIRTPASTAGVVATTDTGAVISTTNDQTNQYVALLSDIDSIDLSNRSVLTNKTFVSLQDFGRTIADRAVGRPNPFAIVTGGSGLVSQFDQTGVVGTTSVDTSTSTGE